MGILIFDIQQLMIANLAMQLTGKFSKEIAEGDKETGLFVNEDLLRHMVLNSIRANKVKFSQYKDIIIATDGFSWRRDIFEHYKASRKTTRDASPINWKEIFKSFEKIREELKEYFPYRVIHVARAEADDIIAQVVYKEGKNQDILILSGDKDLRQLQTFERVKQYDPTRKKFIIESDPVGYLSEHILTGDVSDGIPNALSAGDTFVVAGKRQIPLTKKKLNGLRQDLATGNLDAEILENYERNKKLIDLKYCPAEVTSEILIEYDQQANKPNSKLFTYFVTHKLANLMESINEF